ncbi:hypothetical protein A3G55_03155 [Candidatus Giovannonibacteria bacterium RIFCSPLOWO2_12_FULL_44_25]|uniref:NAD-dependent epimerase/dehydratase domain-containing protein n=2 Tax=Candidatus Giovannoniibacteriota TaxID=1752738 RepID=A0A1F5W7F8_9BACT|nr:MAG: hypothetical protein UW15_C0003G0003 [Parcubacteria group bacterium GW2011_GWC1_44_10]KKT60019.1 MAG: hypothetical protein UW53_C0004G0031 [Candidatus Giovannonibacteria bacterium GW2011_GWA1_44_25]KKU30137.1 MAG: hypothetical protein UX43_C0002G0031 [Candidatus Giovannonibacteria bacterium GW2011_GWB1_46_20]OGF49722.1 MAG: hypothetical protein A2120_00225 [Candidatus Giovannonibacteria bacterium GWA2_45_15]OGF60297.1 MAG: hypothetical protein A2W40_00320 [Candidatus Giovannonibacteria 
MQKKILLTGGTGFIGSHIAARLLHNGCYVYFLARHDVRFSAEERVLRSMAPLSAMQRNQYSVLECDITSDIANISLQDVDEAWHCAASLSFKDEDRIETLATNVGGTKNLLELLDKVGVKRLHFISTAYASGPKFNNPYEESKSLSEELVRKWSSDSNSQFTIYRPSIIVGDSQTGFASKFDGYYTCARSFHLIKKFLGTDLKRNPRNYDESGVYFDGDMLHMPVAFPGLPETLVNLLPVDVAVKSIIACSSESGMFYITNNISIKLKKLVKMSMDVLGICDVYVGEAPTNSSPALLRLNTQIKHASKYYSPYAFYGDCPTFNWSSTTRALGRPIHFPITEKFIRTILGYAIEVNFKG